MAILRRDDCERKPQPVRLAAAMSTPPAPGAEALLLAWMTAFGKPADDPSRDGILLDVYLRTTEHFWRFDE